LSQLRVTAEVVREPKRVLDRLMAEGHKHETETLKASALHFANKFKQEHGVEIVFDESALQRLVERAQAEHMTMPELCAHLFKDFHFGLSLIQKNTGRNVFALNAMAVETPDKYLSELVVQSYYPDAAKA
jgi:hypothetical protein